MATLLPLSVLFGIGILLVFRYTSNQGSIRKAKAQLMAALYEMLLFGDEPLLVMRAQLRLLGANLKYIGLMLVPVAVMALPMWVLYCQLDAVYGLAPLRAGEAALVVLRMRGPLDSAGAPPVLKAPPGIEVESPAVRIPSERQVSWRIRPVRAASGQVTVELPGGTFEKRVDAESGRPYISERRVSSIWSLLWHPGESPLRDGPVEWIEIRHPHAEMRWLGLEMHWAVWFLALSMLSALAFKRKMKVVF